MKFNFTNKKRLVVIGAIILAGTMGVSVLAMPKKAQDEPVQREYSVEKGNVVVGIDAVGAISGKKHPQFSQDVLRIKEYKVAIGEKVKEGDILVEFSVEDIDEKLKAANNKLKEDIAALEKLNAEKQNANLEHNNKINDLQSAGITGYADKTRGLENKKSAEQKAIADKKLKLEQIKTEITNLQAEKDGAAAKLMAIDAEISKLQAENAEYIKQIETLKQDTSVDHSQEITEINNKKTANDTKIAELNNTKATLNSKDFAVEADKLNKEKSDMEAAIEAQNTELNLTASELNAIFEQREKDKSAENDDIDLMKKQSGVQQRDYNSQIEAAKAKYEISKKSKDTLQKYKDNPYLKAEHDGVIFSLGYTQNAQTEPTKAVIELALDSEKTLTIEVDPTDIIDVSVGQNVSFYVDAYPNDTFYGKVKSKGYLQNKNGKFEVTVICDETQTELLDGMGANATLIVKEKTDVFTLSNKAINIDDGKSYVLVKNDKGELAKKYITTGFSNGRITEVQGLADGEKVYTEERYENK